MSPPVVAHAGHWLPQLLYLVPVAILVIALLISRMRERRSRAAQRHTDDTD